MNKLLVVVTAATLHAWSVPAAAQQPAKDANVARALAKAEQTLVMAQCRLDWLKANASAPRTSPAYFSFMAECLTRTATD